MTRHCPTCRLLNPAHARFCSHCGRPVGSAPRAVARLPFANGMVIGLILTGVLVAPRWIDRRLIRRGDADADVFRLLTLPAGKADGLFHLLAPQDVGVIVSRQSNGLRVQGTPREVTVLRQFSAMLTRLEDRGDVRRFVERLARHAEGPESYSLPLDRADLLIRLLALDDVPVIVSGGLGRIHVKAAAGDNVIIRDVVRIVNGERLR